MFVACGVAFAYGATNYNVGNAAKMGPGYFPLMLGVVLAILGALVTLTALTVDTPDGEPIGHFDWRSIFIILGSVALFGFLLQPAGMVISLLVLVIASSFASHEFTWKGTLINAVVMVVLCFITFVWALKLQFPIWPSFIK
jgi:hypothetical protein